jgi:hypothetical protein
VNAWNTSTDGTTAAQTRFDPPDHQSRKGAKMGSFEHDPGPDAFDPVGVEVRSVIFSQDFLPDRSSEWARLHFAGRKRGFELVVGRMIGIAKGAEAHERPSFDGLRKAPSIWLRGYFEMRARLDADELTHALDRDPELANAQGWASERGRYPGLVEDRVSACNAVLPWAFAQHAIRAFDAGAKKLEFDIDVCLQANGRASPSSTPYKWLIVSWVDDQAFRLTAGRPMMKSPREVLRPT